ncbi:MAG: hypothetical protein PVS3B3_29840 [Ktedonobacteraceae bacterium]
MKNEQTLYISPEENLPEICTRLEYAHSRLITLVIPLQAEHLRAFGTWRMLHAYSRRRGITVRIVSSSAYIRSIAHSARFTVAKTLDSPQQEKPLRTRPSTHMSRSVRSAEGGEGMNLLFLADDDGATHVAQHIPHAQPIYASSTFMFTDDDVLTPPHPEEPPVRVPKPPQPLNMPRLRRTRPLTPPRLPWDDVDDELLPPQPLHKLIRRRTHPLVQSIMRGRHGLLKGSPRRHEPTSLMPIAPLLFIGAFVLVRSIVQYLRRRQA